MTGSTVATKYGKVAGIAAAGCLVYRGIPYAAPPMGKLRFAPPKEPRRWQGILKADSFPPRAPQADLFEMPLYGKEFYSQPEYRTPCDEDCLYLNIWAPRDSREGKNYPVAVWIHGGAFDHGYGHELEFDGARWAKRGVILVTINYRLGALGFLAHPALTREREHSGNYGIMDQIAAVKWVKENIYAFGGNRDNITLMGQSAGCISAHILTCSPLVKGDIGKVILQSGAGFDTGMPRKKSLRQAEKEGEEFLRFCGINSIEELRRAPAGFLAQKEGEFSLSCPGGMAFAPIIDGYVLPLHPDDALRQGLIRDIPTLIVRTKDDIGAKDGSNPLMEGIIRLCEKREEKLKSPAFVYSFERDLPGDDAGSFHSSELWYTFGTLDRCWRPMEERDCELSRRMLSAWTNFAKYGEPEKGVWRPYSKADPFVKVFE